MKKCRKHGYDNEKINELKKIHARAQTKLTPEADKKVSREAKVPNQEWFAVNLEKDNYYRKQGLVFSHHGDGQNLGWYTILDIDNESYLVYPYHYQQISPNKEYFVFSAYAKETVPNVGKNSNSSVVFRHSDMRKIQGLDLCIARIPKQHPIMSTIPHIKYSNEINSFDQIKGALKMYVHRDGELQFSVTEQFPGVQDHGEAIYFCQSDKGDCGAPVWNGNNFVGIHVGTNGDNKGNRFVFLSSLQRQAFIAIH